MNILVFGGAGALGSAIARELRSSRHAVTTAGRTGCDVAVDFRFDTTPQAFEALKAGKVDYVIVRPALLVDGACPSTRLFKCLARLPVIVLPGLWHPGASRLASIQVHDVALAVTHLCEYPKALRRTVELAGPQTLTYREMLAGYRSAAGKGAALWLPLPLWLMNLTARLATCLPQKVFSIDTLRMLQAQCEPQHNAASTWLGCMPETAIAQ